MGMSDDEIELVRQAEIQRLNSVVDRSTRRNPDAVAEGLRIADETQVPYPIIERDLDEARRQARLRALNIEDLPRRSPATAAWLQDERRASISSDDIEVLEKLETHVKKTDERPWYDISWSDVKDLWKVLAVSSAKLPTQLRLTLGENTLQAYRGGYLKERGVDDETAARRIREVEEEIIRLKETLKSAEMVTRGATPQDLTTMGEGVRGGLTMIADQAPGLLVSYLTRGKINPTLPYLTGKTFLEGYETSSLRERDHLASLAYAGIDATLEYVTERIPTRAAEKIFGNVGKGEITKLLKKYAMGELLGEQVATLTQSVNAYMFDLDDELKNAKTASEMAAIQIERQVVTLISTIIGTGGVSGAAKAIDHFAGADKAKMQSGFNRLTSSESQDWLDGFVELAQSSKTGPRSEEDFSEFIKSLKPDARVFLSADIAGELEGAPQYIVDQLDGTGADVTMSLADFARDFAVNPEQLAFVRPYIKVREDLQSLAELEANVDSDNVAKMIERARKNQEAATEADTIYEEIKDQLVGTRRQSERTARISAQLIPAYITATQAELRSRGIERSVRELYDDMKLRIVGPGAVPAVTPETVELMSEDERSEYDRAVAKGLPMDEESRKGRARNLGFDVDNVVYHGTKEKFGSFKLGTGWYGDGVYFTDRPEYASEFATDYGDDLENGNVIPVYLKMNRPYEFFPQINGDDSNIQLMEELGIDLGDGVDTDEVGDIIKNRLQEMGHDGLIVFDRVVGNEYIVFDPSQIRSINAAFDPDYTESPMILAQEQDFGDKIFTRKVGQKKVQLKAQDVWDNIQQRKEMVERLRECLKS